MARGDHVTIMGANTVAGGSVSRQPSAGVEELVHEMGNETWEGSAPNGTPACNANIFDGTLRAVIYDGNVGNMASAWFAGARILITNGDYYEQFNAGPGTLDMSFSITIVG